ncbi:hypothetical protein QE385_001821 [Sphingomonas sp. SORGH_AS 950]|uniref:hypothetical protein n=1 Tax=Sphingomonas sp. SORGH_AS_0950 TaxID=3041792 RepID=UPI00277EA877|nr:hypothetical protein [Sphingomonas sp. SORGH_AS_0950]MDQ1157494.1 hypothetical protein [Sphingomonas sp. SORGH_AS_0950]
MKAEERLGVVSTAFRTAATLWPVRDVWFPVGRAPFPAAALAYFGRASIRHIIALQRIVDDKGDLI